MKGRRTNGSPPRPDGSGAAAASSSDLSCGLCWGVSYQLIVFNVTLIDIRSTPSSSSETRRQLWRGVRLPLSHHTTASTTVPERYLWPGSPDGTAKPSKNPASFM